MLPSDHDGRILLMDERRRALPVEKTVKSSKKFGLACAPLFEAVHSLEILDGENGVPDGSWPLAWERPLNLAEGR